MSLTESLNTSAASGEADFPAIRAALAALKTGPDDPAWAEYEQAKGCRAKVEHYEVALIECGQVAGSQITDASLDVAERAVEAVAQVRKDYDEALRTIDDLDEEALKEECRYPYRTDALERLHPDGWLDVSPTPVAVTNLVPTQPDVSIARLQHLLADGEPETGDLSPHVVLHRGSLYVHDGHHRYALAIARGEHTLRCRVVNEAGETPDA